MLGLPKEVIEFRDRLNREPIVELTEVASKLIQETSELVAMWKAYEKRKRADEPWVWIVLNRAKDASSLPSYHYLSRADRNDLIAKIKDSSANLSETLRTNDLDAQMLYANEAVWKGFFIYEDFGDSIRASIDDEEMYMVHFSKLLFWFAERCERKLTEEPEKGKSGKNVKAVRFARAMCKNHGYRYQTPLHGVVATATNAMFGTSYESSDIRKLISR